MSNESLSDNEGLSTNESPRNDDGSGNEKNLDIQCLTKANYILRKTSEDSRLFILLHGYTESADVMFRRMKEYLPEEANILSLSGPYPVPKKLGEGYVMGYSWYFFDPQTRKYVIGYDVCTDYVLQVFAALGFTKNKKTLIGFSQGGYATVHIAEKLSGVDHVIGLGCQFRIKNPSWPKELRVDAVHGDQDDSVRLNDAQADFMGLPEAHRGEFKVFAGAGHGPTSAMLKQVGEWALERMR